MRTPIMHSRARAIALAVVLLSPPAWRAPAAAQDPRPARAQEAKVAQNLDLYVPQDTVPVTRCCVRPPAALRFWAQFNGSYTAWISALIGVPQGGVSWTTTVPPLHSGSGISLQTGGRVDYSASPTTSLGAGNFTVDAWIRVPPGQQGVNPLLDNRVGAGQGLTGFQLFVYNGQIGFQMANGSGHDNFVAPTVVADNRWHFVAVTVVRGSTTGGTIYVDGNPVHTFDPTKRPGSLGTSNALVIGHDLNNGSQGDPFEIDEVEIFRRALTRAEVIALYRHPKCPPTAIP